MRIYKVCLQCALSLWLGAHSFAKAASSPQSSLTIERLAQLTDIASLNISPNGEWAIVQTRTPNLEQNDYEIEWHRFSLVESNEQIDIASGGEAELAQTSELGHHDGSFAEPISVWSPDSERLVFVNVKGETSEIWEEKIQEPGAQRLMSITGKIKGINYISDGEKLYIEYGPSQNELDTALSEEGRDGYLYDVRTDPSYGPKPLTPIALNPNVKIVFEFQTGEHRRASPCESTEFERLNAELTMRFSEYQRGPAAVSSSGAIAWKAAQDSAKQGIRPPLTVVARPPDSKTELICKASECTSQRLGSVWWHEDAEVIFTVFSRSDGPPRTIVYGWRPGNNVLRNILTVEGVVALNAGCEVSRSKLICLYQNISEPQRLVATDLQNGDLETLFDPNGDIRETTLGSRPTWVNIPTEPEFNSYGYLLLPPEYDHKEQLPIIVVTYRCYEFLRGGVGNEYPIYPLAAQGFAVFCFEPPLDDFKGQETHHALENLKATYAPGDPRQRRIQAALEAALNLIGENSVIDTMRTGLTGLSTGAYLVNYALHSSEKKPAAAIVSSVMFDSPNYFLLGPQRTWFRSMGLGAPDETPERWSSISLRNNLNRVDTPLLLNVADREMLLTLSTVTAFQDANKPVEMYIYPDEYHNKWQPQHRLAIYRRNIQWLKFWLKGEEEASPVSSGQYERWRGMRDKQCERLTGDDAPWYCKPGALENMTVH